jgi:hypothetical protein
MEALGKNPDARFAGMYMIRNREILTTELLRARHGKMFPKTGFVRSAASGKTVSSLKNKERGAT